MDGITFRLEFVVILLDSDSQVTNFLDIALVIAGKESPLEFVGQNVMAVIVISRVCQVFFLEPRHVPGLVLGPFQAAVGLHLGQFRFRMTDHVIIFQDIATHQVMVIRNFFPVKQVAGKNITHIHTGSSQGLAAWCTESSTKVGVFTTVADGAVLCLHRFLSAVGTDAVIQAVRTLDFFLDGLPVLGQHFFLGSSQVFIC